MSQSEVARCPSEHVCNQSNAVPDIHGGNRRGDLHLAFLQIVVRSNADGFDKAQWADNMLGRGQESLGRYTGAVAAVQGWVTGAIPAFLLLTGGWKELASKNLAIGLAVFGVVVFGALAVLVKPERSTAPATA